ncbi:uncharacterized protein LOC131675024 [Phymastichus coffea]|uniref:uncharacterized protein LOC131675024 n=1 Tax=Phymastichus coffea TaxID=108790 RepID=UPI00273CC686|nr:uncharacterized protein LOC131675024 [Phymastichus coffea]
MNNKHLLGAVLLGMLLVALFDLGEACKKCGVPNCSCIPMGMGLGQAQGMGQGFGLGCVHGLSSLLKPLCKPSLICKPQLCKPCISHHGGYGGMDQTPSYGHGIGCTCSVGPVYGLTAGYGYSGYGSQQQYYPTLPPYCYGHGYHHMRKPWYKPRCRCF